MEKEINLDIEAFSLGLIGGMLFVIPLLILQVLGLLTALNLWLVLPIGFVSILVCAYILKMRIRHYYRQESVAKS